MTRQTAESTALDEKRPPIAQGATTSAGPTVAPCRIGRVLVVDDDEINQRLACDMLRAMGHLADVASDGPSAISAVARNTYDLVLMDLQMPGMDGLTAIRLIRELPKPAREVAIIVVSASLTPDEIARCKLQVANQCLGKPYSMKDLAEAIDSWLPTSAKLHTAETAELPSDSGEANRPRATEAGIDPRAPAAPLDPLGSLQRAFLDRAKAVRDLLIARLGERGAPGTEHFEFQGIRNAAHKLRGSAASFGFPRIGLAAARVEDAIEEACEPNQKSGPAKGAVRSAVLGLLAELDAALRIVAPLA